MKLLVNLIGQLLDSVSPVLMLQVKINKGDKFICYLTKLSRWVGTLEVIEGPIVAPLAKRERIFKELRRPVFSLLEKGPLAKSCTFLSYESVREIAQLPHLSHLSESIIDEYVGGSNPPRHINSFLHTRI